MATLPGKSRLASTSTSAASTFPRVAITVIKEGHLYKRPRGRNATNLKGLKFQKRYCVLSSHSLEYYESKKHVENSLKPNSTYQIEDIEIVEKVPDKTFRKPYCFQIGSKEEVMYFCAVSEDNRQLWINAFIEAAFEMRKKKRERLYHSGAFGHITNNRWSCCQKKDRTAEGCEISNTCSTFVEDKDAVSQESLEFNTGLLDVTTHTDRVRNNSIWSEGGESGYGQSPANSRRSTAASDSGDREPLVHKRVRTSLQRDSRDSGLTTSAIITEEDLPIRAESGPMLIYTPKSILQSEGDFSYATTVLYRGADSVIAATNTGKVFTSSVNVIDPLKHIIYEADRQKEVSISVWGNFIAIGSKDICLHNLDDSKGTQCGQTQDSLQLVAFSPDGSLFSASEGRNVVRMWSKPKDWAHVDIFTRPVSTFNVAEDGDQIFGMTVSPHPKHSWLAVAVTSPSACDGYSVHIYNYTNKHSFHRIDAEVHTILAFTHDGRHLFIGNNFTIKCLDVENRKENVYYTFKEAGSITSLACSPVRHNLAVGLSTGEVNVFTGHPSEPAAAPHSIPNTTTNGAVTSLSYSRDGMKIAVASNDGKATIWKGSTPLKEPFMVRKRPLTVTNESQTFHSDEDGYTIIIPEGAVKEGTKITLHHDVAPHSPYGPFEFDEGAQPVSPILLLCPEPANTVFLKPIEVTLPHFISCETQEDCNRLSFSKAQHNNFRVDTSRKIFRFEKVLDGKMVQFTQYDLKNKIPQGAATLYTQHCCYICIQEHVSEEETRKACFSLHQIVPRYRTGHNYEVYYCLSYQLKTCNKTVDEQFPSKHFIRHRKAVIFEGQQNVLRIQVNTANLPGNWGVQLANMRNQITEGELCFWDDAIRRDIEELCHTGVYPPRIPVRVTCGEFVRGGVFTTISFSGICGRVESVSREFNLELTKPQPALASLGLDEYEILRDDLQDKLFENANSISCERLALALYSESSIQRCPYLAQESTTREKIKSFLSIAMPPGPCNSSSEKDNFGVNYAILTEALDIADTVNIRYTKVMKNAIELSRPKSP